MADHICCLRVPDFFGKMARNPLQSSRAGRFWTILRRSLTEMAMFVMLLSGWLFFRSMRSIGH